MTNRMPYSSTAPAPTNPAHLRIPRRARFRGHDADSAVGHLDGGAATWAADHDHQVFFAGQRRPTQDPRFGRGGFSRKPIPAGAPELVAKPFKRAVGFIDWHTAVIASGAAIRSPRPELIAQKALAHVERLLSDYLRNSEAGSKFRVRLRLYAGWHSGKTPATYLQGISKVIRGYASKTRSYGGNSVIFEAGHEGLQLGNRLAVVSGRVAPKHGVHFLDTLRHRDGVQHEKMADTALAVDLLGLASRRAADQYIGCRSRIDLNNHP